jgi:hypothetical protein
MGVSTWSKNLWIAVSLALLAAPPQARPGAGERLARLQEDVQRSLPHGGRGAKRLAAEEQARLEKLRHELAAGVDRSALTDEEWLDLHVMLQALDRRLTPRPPAAGGRGDAVGADRFRWLMRHRHQLELAPEELALLGDILWGWTLGELRDAARSVDPTRSWRDLCQEAMEDHPASPEQLLPLCRDLTVRAWGHVAQAGWVTIPECAGELEIIEGPADTNRPYAWYRPGHRAGDRFEGGAIMIAPQPDEPTRLRDVNRHWMQVVTLHEGIPGHHLQFAVAARVASPVRGWAYTATYVEGWALHAEEQMHRAGFYTDPLTRLTQLRMRLWRAARLRIDVGLHCLGRPRAWAEDLLTHQVLLAPENARQEVTRYLHSPTQPSAYILGWLQLETLRREASARAAFAWDERAFHDAVLAHGPIPITLLRAVILEDRPAYDRAHP